MQRHLKCKWHCNQDCKVTGQQGCRVAVAYPLGKAWKDDIYGEEKQSPPEGFLNPKLCCGHPNRKADCVNWINRKCPTDDGLSL
jgi:hypothetical protein